MSSASSHREEPAMDEPIACPQCGAPAQVTARFWLASTAGPIEHLKTGCVNNHWLTPLAEMVEGARPAAHAPAVPELAVPAEVAASPRA
jgi:hypothetical protein